jgi:hypothetical protein
VTTMTRIDTTIRRHFLLVVVVVVVVGVVGVVIIIIIIIIIITIIDGTVFHCNWLFSCFLDRMKSKKKRKRPNVGFTKHTTERTYVCMIVSRTVLSRSYIHPTRHPICLELERERERERVCDMFFVVFCLERKISLTNCPLFKQHHCDFF